MRLETSTAADIAQIRSWSEVDIDKFHRSVSPKFWLTAAPGSYLAGAIDDAEGRVLYFRFDREGDLLRMHTQFAPETVVSRRRVAVAINKVLPEYLALAAEVGISGIVFETVFSALAAFMARIGFVKAEGENNDYILKFAASAASSTEQECVTAHE
jgi:hypothetical protein